MSLISMDFHGLFQDDMKRKEACHFSTLRNAKVGYRTFPGKAWMLMIYGLGDDAKRETLAVID